MSAHQFTPAAPATWSALTSDQREHAVRALTGTGLSSAAIADVLATTKNAVIGLANRRGIQIGADVPVTAYSARVASPAFALGKEVAPETWAPLDAKHVDAAATATFEADWTLRATDSPTRKQCCWPVGAATSPQMYCGGVRHKGSYCTHHAAMAFRPTHPADTKYTDMLKGGKVLSGVEPGITAAEALAVVLPKGKMETEE